MLVQWRAMGWRRGRVTGCLRPLVKPPGWLDLEDEKEEGSKDHKGHCTKSQKQEAKVMGKEV